MPSQTGLSPDSVKTVSALFITFFGGVSLGHIRRVEACLAAIRLEAEFLFKMRTKMESIRLRFELFMPQAENAQENT